MKKNKILSRIIDCLWIISIGILGIFPIFLWGGLLSYLFGYGLIRASLILVFGLFYIWKMYTSSLMNRLDDVYRSKMLGYNFYSPVLAKAGKEEPKKFRVAEQLSVFEDMATRREAIEADLRDFDNRLRMKE